MIERIVRRKEAKACRWTRLPRRRGIPAPTPRRAEEVVWETTLPSPEVLERGSMDPEAASKLLDSWASDDSGYEEKAWPDLRENIERYRLSPRKRFHDADDRA